MHENKLCVRTPPSLTLFEFEDMIHNLVINPKRPDQALERQGNAHFLVTDQTTGKLPNLTNGSEGGGRKIGKDVRRNLNLTIPHSKSKCFREFCSETNVGPWGDAWRLVMGGVRARSSPQMGMFRKHIQQLFPQHKRGTDTVQVSLNAAAIPTVARDELLNRAQQSFRFRRSTVCGKEASIKCGTPN